MPTPPDFGLNAALEKARIRAFKPRNPEHCNNSKYK